MTDLASRIADARKKAEKATPGPWGLFNHDNGKILAICVNPEATGKRPVIVDWPGFDSNDLPRETNVANAHYIAAASPDLFNEMADEIDRLTAEREKREAWIKELEAENDRLLAYWRRKEDEAAARVHADLTGEKEKE